MQLRSLAKCGFNLAETRTSPFCVSAAGSVCRRRSAIKCTSPESETAWYALTVNCQGVHHELRERVRLCPGTHINHVSSHQAFRDPADKASASYLLLNAPVARDSASAGSLPNDALWPNDS